MNNFSKALCCAGVFGSLLALAVVPQRAALRPPQAAEEVPAFHSEVPKGPLPSTMSPTQFTDVMVQNAYTVAARIKSTLYQQPCYCHCDRSQGHTGLLDCFASRHGAGCNICMTEAFYSYEQKRKGKTAAQIREGIIRGDWQSVDLTKYQQPLPVK
jgi:Protein of unknown function with PCYCGC motif